MWEQYRKTAIPMQLFIVTACAVALFIGKMPGLAVAIIFVVMEAGALVGAWWAASINRRARSGRERLPLEDDRGRGPSERG